MPHILDRLHADHEKVSGLIAKLKDTSGGARKTREDLCQKIRTELEAHTRFEEKIFYPAVREQSKRAEGEVDDAIHEHEEVDHILDRIAGEEPTSLEFMNAIGELEKSVMGHVRHEESEIFPMAKKALDEGSAEEMAKEHDRMATQHMKAAAS